VADATFAVIAPYAGEILVLSIPGSIGGLLFGIQRKSGLALPYANGHSLNLGFLSDCVFGIAGAFVIFLIVPTTVQLGDATAAVKLLALAFVGGYGGPAILDTVLSKTLSEVIKKQEEMESKLDAHAQQDAKNARALSLVERQLGGVDTPEIPSQELEGAVREASPAIQLFIGRSARDVRHRNWETNKALMERSIPVFEALLAQPAGARDHRLLAQLAYAHKDKRGPDIARALELLNAAIGSRDQLGEEGYPYYEFNRAICNIELYNKGEFGSSNAQDLENKIVGDLKAANEYEGMAEIIRKTSATAEWLKRTKASLS
jgi:hypothetical protein